MSFENLISRIDRNTEDKIDNVLLRPYVRMNTFRKRFMIRGTEKIRGIL